MKPKKFIYFIFTVLLAGIYFQTQAQVKVTDGADMTLDANSLLELESTNKGLLIPRMAINNLSLPAPLTAPVPTGMLVFSNGGSVTDGFYYWDGSQWNKFVQATVQVNEGGTGLTSGTSGGIPAFTGPTTMSSSGLLSQNSIVVGGGTGATPSSLTIGNAYQVLAVNSAATGYIHRTIKQVLGGWGIKDLDKAETNFPLIFTAGGEKQSDSGSRMIMPFDGRIIGIIIAGSAARTAGTATFTVFNNGSATSVNAVINGSNPQRIATNNGNVSFSAGDILDLRASTTVSYNPTNIEYNGWIIIEWID
ncbi:MAG: hypothetical protein QNK30_06990 [Bacteroidales bacterium]|nr:hypothetical protein [Bacteroidales bacterium]